MKNNFSRAVLSYDQNSTEQFQSGNILVNWLIELIKEKSIFDNSNKEIKIIDLGCGTGKLTKRIAQQMKILKKKFSIMAIDQSKKMIEYANKKYSDNQIDFIHSEIEKEFLLPKKNCKKITYDIFFSNAVLHWLDDLFFFFSNLKKIPIQKVVFFFLFIRLELLKN